MVLLLLFVVFVVVVVGFFYIERSKAKHTLRLFHVHSEHDKYQGDLNMQTDDMKVQWIETVPYM